MKRWRFVAGWAVAGVAAWSVISCVSLPAGRESREVVAKGLPERASLHIELKKTRWNVLPAEICSVFVGPDQRRWYVRTPGEGPVDVAAVKEGVAAEWSRRAPVLTDCWPALFEKSGAAWLVTRDRRTLLRYDGHRWLARAAQSVAEAAGEFVGICPGHGRPGDLAYNLEAGGAEFFVESGGISAFDGGTWTFQAFGPGAKTGTTGPLVMHATRAGEYVLAFQVTPPALWRYRAGEWAAVELAPLRGPVTGAAIAPDGMLWVCGNGGITAYREDGQEAGGGPEASGKAGPVPPLVVGGWEVNRFTPSLGQDDTGTIYISIRGLPRELSNTAMGTLVLRPEGVVRFLKGAQLPLGLRGAAISGDGGRTLWYGGTNEERGLHSLDLTVDPPRHNQMTAPRMQFVQAVAADGTVYLGYGDRTAEAGRDGLMSTTVAAYRAEAPDERCIIAPPKWEVADQNVAVAGDGAVWAPIPDRGLCRFDGREWRKVCEEVAPGGVLIPARQGAMLRWARWGGESFALIQGDRHVEGEDLAKLMAANRAAFTQAMGAAADPSMWREAQQRMGRTNGRSVEGGWSIAVDKKSRLWLTMDRALKVLDDSGTWQELPWPAGSAPVDPKTIYSDTGTGPTLVLALGDGSAMYVVDLVHDTYYKLWTVPAKRKAYVVTLDGGQATWTEAPAPTEDLWRAPDGALWVVYRRTPVGKPGGAAGQIIMARVEAAGVTAEYELPAVPALVDRSGILWLAARDANGTRSGDFYLWKEGKVVGRVQAPGIWEANEIVCDKPGSVWVWTSLGLCHLAAEDARKPLEYRVKSMLVLDGLENELFRFGGWRKMACCDQGLLIKSEGPGERPYSSRHWVQFVATENR